MTPPEANEGFPVTNETVKRKCGGCHRPDEQGRMTRISFRRTTPEGWEETVKRMISLNHLEIEPAEAREVVRYLADHQGLAPEEAKPASFEVERRQIEYQYTADKDTERTCTACHSMGRIISQRRTKGEWEGVVAMHRGYYPLVDGQTFRGRGGPPGQNGDGPPDARPADNRAPMDKAIAHLSGTFPLVTPEWTAWSATMRPPRLEGRWAISGYQLGKGSVYGEVTITPIGGADSSEFTTETTFTYAKTGKKVTRRGRTVVYTGFQWRGRSTEAGATSGPLTPAVGPASETPSDWREVLFVDRDWQRADGRWFTGAYDEFGIDVQMQRITPAPSVLGSGQPLLKAGASRQQFRVFGENLPTRLAAGDVNCGPGVTVDQVVSATPEMAVLSLSIASDAAPGRRTVLIAGTAGSASLSVYSTIDSVKVQPEAGLARVGGANVPKQYQQFEAIAYANGPDGLSGTKDDIELGPVDATWTLEEYTATYHDDDRNFVGTIDETTGLFTPNLDGPNPQRRNGTDNFGDVWVVATMKEAAGSDKASRPLKGRAHLLVTVPIYLRWYGPEVAK
jgi:quinohemoprotein amine dehydrogenase